MAQKNTLGYIVTTPRPPIANLGQYEVATSSATSLPDTTETQIATWAAASVNQGGLISANLTTGAFTVCYSFLDY
jgi:hypothetical protein